LSRGFRALGLRNSVGRFDSCTTYWFGEGARCLRGPPEPLQPDKRRFLESLCEGSVAKIKGKRGFRFIKELGGAVRRETVSRTARFLDEHRLLRGRVLDYGCGFGFDADHFGWEAYDPHYRQKLPDGLFDTVVCNHVANMLTRDSRQELFRALQALLAPQGKAYVSVSRKIPKAGKVALRKRIQNYVVLTLPSLSRDDELEIYRLEAGSDFEDRTQEIEDRL
jgi:Methyltransferase domain